MFSRIFAVIAAAMILAFFGCATGNESTADRTQTHAFFQTSEPRCMVIWRNLPTVAVDSVILFVEGDEVNRLQSLPGMVRTLLADGARLWIGTDKGLYVLAEGASRPAGVSLPCSDEHTAITALARNATGEVWVGTERSGVFRLQNGIWRLVTDISPIICAAAAPDSCIWLGTHAGLYRYRDTAVTFYSGEGLSGATIHGTAIEKLFADQAGNLWLIISDGVMIISGGQTTSGFGYIGVPQNTVFDVVQVNQGGYLVASALGPLYLAEPPADAADTQANTISEARQKGKAALLADAEILVPARLTRSLPRCLAKDEGGNIWFAAQGGMWKLSAGDADRLFSGKRSRLLSALPPFEGKTHPLPPGGGITR
jgi:ligand-binding sensor domain-containing protein